MARLTNGTTDRIICTNTSANPLQLPEMTFVGHFKFDNFNSAYSCLISLYDGTYGLQLTVKSNGKLGCFTGSGRPNYDGTGSNTLSTGNWYHLAVTYNMLTSLVGYVGGSVDQTVAANGVMLSLSNDIITLGYDRYVGRAFAGSLADCAIYSEALNINEISALSKGARPYTVRPSSLRNYWPLDGLTSPEPDLACVSSTRTDFGIPGSTNYSSGYTVISRFAPFINSTTISNLEIYSIAAFSGKLKIFLRNGAGDFTLIQEQAWSHGGTGWEVTSLSSPYSVPATGSYYVGIYSASNPGNSCGSQLRSYHAGDTGTSTGWTENTGGSFGCRTPKSNILKQTDNANLTGTAYAPGPPVTMFTPRWPRNDQIPVTTIPLSQTHFRFRTDTNAVDATPTWGDAEDAA